MFKNKSFMEIANTFAADITVAHLRFADAVVNKIAGASDLAPVIDSTFVAPFLYEGRNTLLLNIYWPPTWAAYNKVLVDHVVSEFEKAVAA